MSGSIISYLSNFFQSGDQRSVKAKKNIVAGFGVKGFSVLIGLVKVPILLSYLDAEKYGIWLTIASIVEWVHYFDLGIGHGFRNKFAESLANNDKERAKRLVSTAYYYITLIFSGVGALLVPLVFLINWQSVLNTSIVSQNELTISVLFVLIMFVLKIILYQISMILKADQRPALSDIFLPIASVITLIMVILLKYISKDSLFLACVAISAPPVLVLLFTNLYFFKKDYHYYRPSLKDVDKSKFNDVISLGLKFFIVQLAGLVMYSSSNIILTQVVDPSEVTLYNISRQYLMLPYMLFGIILNPFWSAITDAYVKGEYDWIRKTMHSLLGFSIFFSICEIILLLASPLVYHFWIGDQILVPFSLSLVLCIMFIFNLFGAPFSYFINGTGKLQMSIRINIVQIVLFLPLSIWLTSLLGAVGLVISMIIANLALQLLIAPIQYYKVVSQKANGLWNK